MIALAHPPHVPVIVITTNGVPIVEGTKIVAQMRISRHVSSALSPLSHDVVDYDGPIGIEIRGRSSASFPKKSYGVETRNAMGEPAKVPLLGMPDDDDWVLHGPYTVDQTLIKNALVYEMSRRIGRYAPRTRMVEVFVNESATPTNDEHYVGVYALVEAVRRGGHRVDVQSDDSGRSVSGGYILKIDERGADEASIRTEYGESGYSDPTQILFHYPSAPPRPTADQQAWVKDFFDAFEAALAGPHFNDRRSGYNEFVDIPSFIDFMLLNEVFKNNDAYRLSTFMHKDPDLDPTHYSKLRMGPVWDFDRAMPLNDFADELVAGKRIDDFPKQPFWWKRLLESERFVKRLLFRWDELRADPFDPDTLDAVIDQLVASLHGAEERNLARWPAMLDPPGDVRYSTYDELIAQFKLWIRNRILVLDTIIWNLAAGFGLGIFVPGPEIAVEPVPIPRPPSFPR